MNIDRMLAQLTDREVDKLLDGRNPVQGHEIDALIGAIETLRSTRAGAQPPVGADLEAVFSHGLAADDPAPPEWAIPPDAEPSVRTPWRTRLRTRTAHALIVLGVPLGTLAGKLMIGAVAAAAAVAGLSATGVVGIPGLPDRSLEIDEVRDQDHPPALEEAEDAGNAGPDEAEGTGDIQDNDRAVDRDPAVEGGDQSEPATTGEPPSSSEPSDQFSAGPGSTAQDLADAPGQSEKAKNSKKAQKPKNGGKKAGKGKKGNKGNPNTTPTGRSDP
jgi:hypothetical protein